MRTVPWMPDRFEFQQNYAGGQQAWDQANQQTVQNWQNQQGGPTGPRGGKAEAQILIQQGDPQQTGLGGLLGNRNLRDLLNNRKRDLFADGNHPLINTRGGGQHPLQEPFIQKPHRGRPYRPYEGQGGEYWPGPRGGLPGRPGYQPSLDDFGPPRGRPWQGPQGGYPGRPKQPEQYDVAGGFEEFGETLGGYKETLGGYGEQLGGFGETLGGYGEQISGFEEQLGGFGEQFSGIQEQVGGVGEDIGEINERLGDIEEGISTLSISKPEQKQNPYGNMFNPFSFIGNWGGSRSRMSYR